MKYTLEQFEKDFENAPDSMKNDILIKAIDELDMNDLEFRNRLQDYKQELKDIKFNMTCDEDARCNSDIDNGVYKLYTCIKEVPKHNFIVGEQYYAQVEDVKKKYSEHIERLCGDVSKITPEISEYLSKLKSFAYIIVDDGIGTFKKREIFTYSVVIDGEEMMLEFNDYFKE